jgi:hypothetical protein
MSRWRVSFRGPSQSDKTKKARLAARLREPASKEAGQLFSWRGW